MTTNDSTALAELSDCEVLTRILHLSEHAPYNRIETARVARRFPLILELVESAAVTLTTVRLLSPHLTEANHRDVLERARHKSKREIEMLAATLNPRPDVPSMVRTLPASPAPNLTPTPSREMAPDPIPMETAASVSTTPRPAEVTPLAPERYKIQFTVGRGTYEKLRRAQDLLRHSIPTGDPAIIFGRGLDLLLTELERTKFAAAMRPRISSCDAVLTINMRQICGLARQRSRPCEKSAHVLARERNSFRHYSVRSLNPPTI